MKNSHSIVVITAVILISSFIFCFVFAGIPETNRLSAETFATEATEETTSFTHLSTEGKKETTDAEEKNTTVTPKAATTKKPTATRKPATTKKPVTTKKPAATEYTTKYNIREMENRLISEEWHFYDDNGEYRCRFFSDGTYEIYNENGYVCKSGYYCLDGNNLFLFNQCGDVISKMIYDTKSEEFFGENYKKENATAKTTIPTTTASNKNTLNDSNVLWLLSNAVACYDDYVNSTTFGLEYDYFGETVTCPHCGEQAFLVTNYNSYSEVIAPVNKYLTGDAKDAAMFYIQETADCGMLIEYAGNLYVCGMYNEKGYCRLNCSSIRLVSEYSDGSYRIAVDDIEGEETYYLDVYFTDGEYKIG